MSFIKIRRIRISPKLKGNELKMDPNDVDKVYRDEEERKQFQDFKVGNRRTPLSNNVLLLLGDLLQPQTEGFDHINMDMSFTNLDFFDLQKVENSSFLITWCSIWGLKRPMYLERNTLATLLVSKRSFRAKSMDLFTNTVTHQHQEFVDKTEKKTGFERVFGGGKGSPEGGGR